MSARGGAWLLAWAVAMSTAHAVQVAGSASGSGSGAPAGAPAEPLDLAALLSARSIEAEGVERTATRIVGLGTPALATILLSLADGQMRSGDRVLPLNPTQKAALEAAARRFGRPSVTAWCQEQLGQPEDAASRRAALAGLMEVGTAADMPLALSLAKLADPTSPDAQRVAASLERTTVALLQRDARTFDSVRKQVLDLEEMRAQPLLAALGSQRTPRSAHLLFELLPDAPARLKPIVLGYAANVAPWAHHPLSGRIFLEARAGLRSPDEGTVRASMAAVGATQDFESAEPLIDMLEGEAAGRARMAEVALRELTGLNLGALAGPWRQWLERERKWYLERSSGLIAELESPSPAAVLQAVQELGSYRYNRQELGLALAPALRRSEPHVKASACRALKALGSIAPRRELLECLQDPNAEVSAAALECLQKVTGFKAPADADEWARLIGEAR